MGRTRRVTGKHSGFTLIEVMLAIAIFAAGILLLTQSWGSNYSTLKSTQKKVEIASLLEQKIAEVRIEFEGKPLDSIPEEKEDDFGSDYPGYRWKLESRPVDIPIGQLLGGENNQEPDQMMTLLAASLTEFFKKSIKEVRVSVIYSAAKNPVTATVTTYFIDYDKDIPLPGGAN